MNRHRVISILLLAAAGARASWYYPRLPDRVASHFDAFGHPNAWLGKGAFLAIYFGIFLFVMLIFTALPPLLARLPDEAINLPNKRYWLAPGRREGTLKRVTSYLYEFGNPSLAILACTLELSLRSNIRGGELDAHALWTLMGAYLVYLVVWIVRFQRAFRVPARG